MNTEQRPKLYGLLALFIYNLKIIMFQALVSHDAKKEIDMVGWLGLLMGIAININI